MATILATVTANTPEQKLTLNVPDGWGNLRLVVQGQSTAMTSLVNWGLIINGDNSPGKYLWQKVSGSNTSLITSAAGGVTESRALMGQVPGATAGYQYLSGFFDVKLSNYSDRAYLPSMLSVGGSAWNLTTGQMTSSAFAGVYLRTPDVGAPTQWVTSVSAVLDSGWWASGSVLQLFGDDLPVQPAAPGPTIIAYAPPIKTTADGFLVLTKVRLVVNNGQILTCPIGEDDLFWFHEEESSASQFSFVQTKWYCVETVVEESSSSSTSSSSLSSSKSSASSSSSSSVSLSASSSSSSSSSSHPGPLYKLNYAAAMQGINVGNASALQISGNLTLSAWIFKSTSSGRDILSKGKSATSTFPQGGINLGATDTNVLFEVFNSSGTFIGGVWYSSITSATLHHIAITWDGTNSKLYIDGSFITSMSGPGGAIGGTTSPWKIGGWDFTPEGGDDTLWDGTLDAIRIYNATLTAAQITELYGHGIGLSHAGSASANLKGWWKCDEGSGSVINDSSGFGSTGPLDGQTFVSATILG